MQLQQLPEELEPPEEVQTTKEGCQLPPMQQSSRTP